MTADTTTNTVGKTTMTKDTIKQALEALRAVSGYAVCTSAHHTAKDRHGVDELCPIEQRHNAALAALEAEQPASDAPQLEHGGRPIWKVCDDQARFEAASAAPVQPASKPEAWIERRYLDGEMVHETVSLQPLPENQKTALSKHYDLEIIPLTRCATSSKEASEAAQEPFGYFHMIEWEPGEWRAEWVQPNHKDKPGVFPLYRGAASQPVADAPAQEPVAWLHDQPERFDVIHDLVKSALQGANSASVQRPAVDKTEHYTIPLYATPQPAPQPCRDAAEQLQSMRALLHVTAMRANPSKTHDEISAEIDRALRTQPAPEAGKAGEPAAIGYITTGEVFHTTEGAEINGWDVEWNHKIIDAMPEFAQPETTYDIYLRAATAPEAAPSEPAQAVTPAEHEIFELYHACKTPVVTKDYHKAGILDFARRLLGSAKTERENDD